MQHFIKLFSSRYRRRFSRWHSLLLFYLSGQRQSAADQYLIRSWISQPAPENMMIKCQLVKCEYFLFWFLIDDKLKIFVDKPDVWGRSVGLLELDWADRCRKSVWRCSEQLLMSSTCSDCVCCFSSNKHISSLCFSVKCTLRHQTLSGCCFTVITQTLHELILSLSLSLFLSASSNALSASQNLRFWRPKEPLTCVMGKIF